MQLESTANQLPYLALFFSAIGRSNLFYKIQQFVGLSQVSANIRQFKITAIITLWGLSSLASQLSLRQGCS